MTTHAKLKPSLFVGLICGLLLAVLAFSQSAASIGLAIDGFRPLGGSFFSWRVGQTNAALTLSAKGTKVNAAAAERLGQAALEHAPLTTRSLWLVGKSMEIRGELPKARHAMLQAERISRRDGAVQLWLGVDSLRQGSIAPGLRHFDLMIRSDMEAADVVMPRLALIILSPTGRQYLSPYIRESNPWMLNLLQVAVTDLPQAAPIAELLIERGKKAPDIHGIRQVYSILMDRLVKEKSYTLALRLYPLLPGAREESLRNVSGTEKGKVDQGYPPFTWLFSNDSARGADFVGVAGGKTGLDIFGAPGTIGIAATKFLALRPDDYFFWSIKERGANLDGGATWIATCLVGAGKGKEVVSGNMLNSSISLNRIQKMPMPADCQLVRLDMRVSGGIGRDPVNLIVGDMDLVRNTKGQ